METQTIVATMPKAKGKSAQGKKRVPKRGGRPKVAATRSDMQHSDTVILTGSETSSATMVSSMHTTPTEAAQFDENGRVQEGDGGEPRASPLPMHVDAEAPQDQVGTDVVQEQAQTCQAQPQAQANSGVGQARACLQQEHAQAGSASGSAPAINLPIEGYEQVRACLARAPEIQDTRVYEQAEALVMRERARGHNPPPPVMVSGVQVLPAAPGQQGSHLGSVRESIPDGTGMTFGRLPEYDPRASDVALSIVTSQLGKLEVENQAMRQQLQHLREPGDVQARQAGSLEAAQGTSDLAVGSGHHNKRKRKRRRPSSSSSSSTGTCSSPDSDDELSSQESQQSSSACRVPKSAKLIPPFTAEKESWKAWHARFEAIAVDQGWSTREKLSVMIPKLQGKAGDFVFEILPEERRRSYDVLVKELKTRYRKVESERSFQMQLRKFVQKPGQTEAELAAELKQLYDRAYPRRPPKVRRTDLVTHFFSALLDDGARQDVEFNKNPRDIDQAVDYVVRYRETRKQGRGTEKRSAGSARAVAIDPTTSAKADDDVVVQEESPPTEEKDGKKGGHTKRKGGKSPYKGDKGQGGGSLKQEEWLELQALRKLIQGRGNQPTLAEWSALQRLLGSGQDMKKGSSRGPRDYSDYICNRCGVKGHIARYCQQATGPGQVGGGSGTTTSRGMGSVSTPSTTLPEAGVANAAAQATAQGNTTGLGQ